MIVQMVSLLQKTFFQKLTLTIFPSDVETHELYIEDTGSENSPPMFGGLCCRMAAMPYCCEEPVMSGQVKISGKQVIFKEMYASLMDWQLSIWNNKEQKESARRPVYVIPISRDTCVLENDDSAISITNEAQTWIVQLENSDDKVRRERLFSYLLLIPKGPNPILF